MIKRVLVAADGIRQVRGLCLVTAVHTVAPSLLELTATYQIGRLAGWPCIQQAIQEDFQGG